MALLLHSHKKLHLILYWHCEGCTIIIQELFIRPSELRPPGVTLFQKSSPPPHRHRDTRSVPCGYPLHASRVTSWGYRGPRRGKRLSACRFYLPQLRNQRLRTWTSRMQPTRRGLRILLHRGSPSAGSECSANRTSGCLS